MDSVSNLKGNEQQEPAVSVGGGSTNQPPQTNSPLSYITEFLKIFIVAAAIILPIRLFLIQPFYVKGASMEPNFFENEYLIIDKISPHFKPFERGEVIVFRYPKTDHRFLIKRVIGLPGEKIVIKNQAVTIFNVGHPNGLQLDETSYNPRELSERLVVETLAKDEYFVLGDNRPVSFDSERFGAVTEDQIVGRVVFRGLPINRIGILKGPSYRENQ